MISLQQFAEFFQDELNEALNAADESNNNEIEFAIWADSGKFEKAVRNGNTVNCKIHGLLAVSTGANDANNVIAIGVNGLVLNLLVPLYRPRTGTYPIVPEGNFFAEAIRELVVDNYFQQSRTTFMTDGNGVRYAVSFKAGMAATGETALRPAIGNSVIFSVYIEVTFAEGGISSKAITVSIDGNLIPFQTVRFGRAPTLERNVYSGSSDSTVFSSSTAFSIDADFPATENGAPQTALDYLLFGEQNTAHFVDVQWTKTLKKSFFMAFANTQNAAAGTNIMGISAALVELAGNPCLYGVPKDFGLYKFKFSKSAADEDALPAQSLQLLVSAGVTPFFVAGVGVGVFEKPETKIPLTEESFEWNEDEQAYYVTLVTMSKVKIFKNNAEDMTVLQG